MKGLGKEIGKHMFRLTITKGNVIRVKAVSDEEITNIDISGPLAGGCMPVLFKSHCTLVVLFKITVTEGETLSFQEVLNPNGTGKIFTSPDKFSLCIAFCHECLVDLQAIPPRPKVITPASMTLHVIVHGKGSVHEGIHGLYIISPQD